MRKIRFQTLKILSYREKRAAIINLDCDAIIVEGGNHAGKSCILKSLYFGLGGEIKNFPQGWNQANIVLLLKFTIDGVHFKSLRMGNDIYVFNPDGSLRFKEKRGTEKLNKKINELFDLTYSVEGRNQIVPVSALYMPFYIDQDLGWSEPWSSFSKTGNATERSNYRQFLTTVVDNSFFQKKNELINIEKELNKAQAERRALQKIQLDVQRQYKTLGIQMTESEFQKSVDNYLRQLTELREEQKSIMRQLQALYTRKSYLDVNIDQLKKNIKDIDKDFNYALHLDDIITCPTCGGQYHNDMLARHELLKDMNICKDQVIIFEQERDEIVIQIESVKQRNTDLNTKIANVQSAIKEKEKDVTLEQVIEDRTRTYLIDTVSERQACSNKLINDLTNKYSILEAAIKDYENNGRRDYINKEFINYVVSAVHSMGNSIKSESVRFSGKISTSGSLLPIHVVAYTTAYLQIFNKFSGPLMMPLVIDEPRQQGIHSDSLNKMLQYLKDSMHGLTQLIVSSTDENVIIPDGYSVISLKKGETILNDEYYDEVSLEVEKLLEEDFFKQILQ